MTAENTAPTGEITRGDVRASMRPRPMTAENCTSAAAPPRRPGRFNEAAADDRGKLSLISASRLSGFSLQ